MKPIHFRNSITSLIAVMMSLLLTGCQSTPPKPDAGSAKWEPDIQKFEAAPKPAAGGTLLAGSSSFRMWKTAAADLSGKVVINHGFGGSQMSDLLAYADRIVIPYAPSEILVYEGDNDLANGKSPDTIVNQFVRFTRIVHRKLPKATIYFVSIKPSPKRIELLESMREANRLIEQLCDSKPWLGYIDVFTPMLDESGAPRAELFIEDQLHMNSKGYAIWTEKVREALKLPAAR